MRQKNYYLQGLYLLVVIFVSVPVVLAVETDTTLFIQAKVSLDAIQYQQALEKFQAFINQYPASTEVPEAMYYAAKCNYRLKNYTEATTGFCQLINSYPANDWAKNGYRMLGYSYSILKQDALAVSAFENFIRVKPDSPYIADAWLRIANIKVRNPATYSLEEQIATFQKIIDFSPNSTEVREAQERVAALKHRQGALTASVVEYDKILNDPLATDSAKANAQLQKAGLIFEIAKGEDKSYPILDTDTRKSMLAQVREECKKVHLYNPSSEIIKIAEMMYFETFWPFGEELNQNKLEDTLFKLLDNSTTFEQIYTSLKEFHNGVSEFGLSHLIIPILEKVMSRDTAKADVVFLSQIEVGRFYMNFEEWEKAREWMRKAIQTYVTSALSRDYEQFLAFAQYNVAVSYFNQRLWKEVIQEAEQLEVIIPVGIKLLNENDDVVGRAYFLKAEALKNSGKLSEAIEIYQIIEKNWPGTSLAQLVAIRKAIILNP
jgi:outer membrane protein assembly factor BamD (BamD/ComL family)